jgi:NAD kinase
VVSSDFAETLTETLDEATDSQEDDHDDVVVVVVVGGDGVVADAGDDSVSGKGGSREA